MPDDYKSVPFEKVKTMVYIDADKLAHLEAVNADLLAALVALCDASPLAALLPPEEAKPFSEAYAAARAAIAKASPQERKGNV